MGIEETPDLILNRLIYDNNFFRKVYPFLKNEYFVSEETKKVFSLISNYVSKYNAPPSYNTLCLLLNELDDLNENLYKSVKLYLKECLSEDIEEEIKEEFLLDITEKFCKDQAMQNAIFESIRIIDGDSDKHPESIPDIVKDALKVSFDSSIGLDYDDVEERYDRLHRKNKKIPFDIEALNIITNGGLEEKTLNCILASTGLGKTAFMCHCAASALTQGKNVLYITLEMAEEKISQRIDANLMDITLDDLETLSKEEYIKKFNRIKKGHGFLSKLFGIKQRSVFGKLYIKEYPTGAGNANHFRFLLDELKLKKDFDVDFILIDYINICSSTRILPMAGSYAFVKSIAEELRGLAVEYNVPILTGTQTNRGGFSSNDIDITDTSESIGLPATLDLYLGFMSNDKLSSAGRIAIKQLKNRYRDENKNKYFSIGIDKPKMRFYHVDDWVYTAEEPEEDLVPITETVKETKNTKNVFEGIKL